jgi:FtsH-binding integral membrane protein
MPDLQETMYPSHSGSAANAESAARGKFIRNTYLHTALAILAFAGVETILIISGFAEWFASLVFSTGFSWFLVLLAFMGVSYLADNWARSDSSKGMQYLGLGLYIVAEAVIFAPLILIAVYYSGDPRLLPMAGLLTLFLFGGLTALALITKTDYSFLRGFLAVGGLVALGLIVAGMLFGFSLGLWFSGAMIIFAGAAILYNTSNIMHYYRPDQYVAASLSLFASVALLFYYILTFLLQFSRR